MAAKPYSSCTTEACRRESCESVDAAVRHETRQKDLTRTVMCDVTPSCVTELLFAHEFWSAQESTVWASRCRRWRRDDEWPTFDPHLQRTELSPRARSFWDVVQLLGNRTIWVHGDSITLQMCDAAFCSLMRAGAAPFPAPQLHQEQT